MFRYPVVRAAAEHTSLGKLFILRERHICWRKAGESNSLCDRANCFIIQSHEICVMSVKVVSEDRDVNFKNGPNADRKIYSMIQTFRVFRRELT